MTNDLGFPEPNAPLTSSLYNWEIKLYVPGDEEKDKIKPAEICEINVAKGYRGSYAPMMSASLRFHKKDLYKLKIKEKDLIVSVNLTRIDYVTVGGSIRVIKSDTSIISDEFLPVFATDTFPTTRRYENLKDTSATESEHGTGDAEFSVMDPVINMGLIYITAQKISKIPICQCFSPGLNIADALMWVVANSNKYIKRQIVDLPTNTNPQDYVVLPPSNFVAAIKTLQSVYGVYDTGLDLFCDDDSTLYVLNRYALDHDCVAKDVMIIDMYMADPDAHGIMAPYRAEKDGKVSYRGDFKLMESDDEILESELAGDSFLFSSYEQTVNAVVYQDGQVESSTVRPIAKSLKRNIESHKYSGEKEVVDYDELNNPYGASSLLAELEHTAKRYSFNIPNPNIVDFRPNKYVQLHFRDSGKEHMMGGKYHIFGVEFKFATPSEWRLQAKDPSLIAFNGLLTRCNGTVHISRKDPEVGK